MLVIRFTALLAVTGTAALDPALHLVLGLAS